MSASTVLRRLLNAGAAIVITTALMAGAGCSADTTAEPESEQTCFTELDPAQKQQMIDYSKEQGSQVQTDTANANGTSDICVIDAAGNERMYAQDDGFSDYLLYSMMLGHSNALLTYGLVSGDLDPSQVLMLSLLTGVTNDGRMYHPYTYNQSDRSYYREPTLIDRRVTNVYYGTSSSAKPIPFAQAKTQAPAKYQSQWRKPITAADTTKQATLNKDASGKTTVATTQGKTVTKKLTKYNKTVSKSNTTTGGNTWQTAPPKSSTNKNNTSGGSGSGSSGSGSSGGNKGTYKPPTTTKSYPKTYGGSKRR